MRSHNPLSSDVMYELSEFHVPMPMRVLDWVLVEELNWEYLSRNLTEISILEANLDKVNWRKLSMAHVLRQ